MKKYLPSDEISKQMVKAFCGQVRRLRINRHTYKELFEDIMFLPFMNKTAASFFVDLQMIWHSHLLLEFVKITDPKEIGGRENLTLENLIDTIEWPEEARKKLALLYDKTRDFRGYTNDARNKILAHLDKEVFLKKRILGKFPEGKDEEFLKTLEEVCDITHEICFGRILGDIVLARPGDVLNLKKALEKAVTFDRLLSETAGRANAKLESYFAETVFAMRSRAAEDGEPEK